MSAVVAGVMLLTVNLVFADISSTLFFNTTIDTEVQDQIAYENPDSLTAIQSEAGHPESEANDDDNDSFWQANHTQTIDHYSDSTQSATLFMNSSRPLVGEYVTNTSALIGDDINQITLNIRKVGSPTESATVGIFDANVTTSEQEILSGSPTTAVASSEGPPTLIVNNADTTVNLDAGDSVGERPNEKQSLLYNYPLTTMTNVRLAKTGSPLGDVVIGVMNSSGLPAKVFRVINASQLSTTLTDYNGTGSQYFVGLGEAVGVYFNGTGSQTSGAVASNTNRTTIQSGVADLSLNSGGNTIAAERADTGSAMINQVINSLEVRLYRSFVNVTGTVTLGVFDASGNTLFTFCTLDAAQLTILQQQIVCINETSTHTVALNNRIGVKYASGDSVRQVRVSSSGSNPFDGTASYRELFAGSWTATTSSDVRIVTKQTAVKPSGTFAIDFDGANSAIQTNSNRLIANNTSTASFFADISPDTLKDATIIGTRRASNTAGVGFETNSAGNLVFSFYPVDGSGVQTFTDSRVLPTAQFSRVGAIFNGTHVNFCISRVCVLDDNVISSKTIKVNPENYFRIGHREAAGAANERFDGKIDNILVYSTAKTTAQAVNIQEGYNDQNGLVARYDFDEGVGSYAWDTKGTADGTLQSTTYVDGFKVGSYIRASVSTTESFDHTDTNLRTTFAAYDVDTAGWVPDSTKDMRQTVSGTTTSAFSSIDTDLTTFWQNNNPANINSTSVVLDYSKLIGANYDDFVLQGKFSQGQRTPISQSTYDSQFATFKAKHMTLMRVAYNWEAYEVNSANFLTALDRIVAAAEANDILVFFEFFHFNISSRFTNIGLPASGFPEFVVNDYDDINCYSTDYTVPGSNPPVQCTVEGGQAFWDDFWTNSTSYNGTNIWQDMANFEKIVIDRVDDSDNVIGYGVLNEPHFWKTAHYSQAHNFGNFMYDELREVTDKDLHFDRETAQGVFQRQPANQYLMMPDPPAFGLVYQPHHYDRTTFQSQINTIEGIDGVYDDIIAMGHDQDEVAIVWGEWGVRTGQCGTTGAPSASCLAEMDSWLSQAKTLQDSTPNRGFVFWKFNNYAGSTAGRFMYNPTGMVEQQVGEAFDQKLPLYYDLDELDSAGFSEVTEGGGGATTDVIFLNFTNPLSIDAVVLRHQNADFVPADVCLYISNSTSNWGTAAECVTLTASAGNQTVTVSPVKVGTYLKVEPGVFENARFWRLQMVDAGQSTPFPIVITDTEYQVIPVRVFGTITPDILTGSFQSITRTLSAGNYTIADGDFIGINFDEDSATNYIEVRADAGGAFDGTASQLMYALNNVTTFVSSQDLSGEFSFTTLLDNPTIYADMGESKNVTKIRIHKPDGASIPATIDISIADTLDNQTGEPQFVAVVTNHTLTQSVGTEEIDFTDTTGRYIQIRANTLGTDTQTKIGEFDVQTNNPLTIEFEVSDSGNENADDASGTLQTSTWLILNLASFGVLVYVLFNLFGRIPGLDT